MINELKLDDSTSIDIPLGFTVFCDMDGTLVDTDYVNYLSFRRALIEATCGMHDVEFTDGSIEKYTANVIAENMFAQVDDEGHQFLIMKEITDHRKDNTAVPISDGTITSSNGNVKPKVTTRGWELLVQWKDGSMSWEKLKDRGRMCCCQSHN